MRALIILDNAFIPDPRVLKELRILKKRGVVIDLLCWDRDSNLPEEEQVEEIIIKRFKIRSGFQLGVYQLKCLIRFYISVFSHIWKRYDQYDLIWVHDYPVLLLGVILRMFSQLPLVYDAHEIYYLMEYEKYSPFIRVFLKYTEVFFIQFVDRLITTNELRSRYYQRYYNKRGIYIVGNWFDPIDLDRETLSRGVRKPDVQFTIGYFGTLAKSRELGLLLKLAEEKEKISILIAGRGPEEENLKRISSGLKNVKFLGWIEDIYSILHLVDVLYYVLNKERIYSNWSSPNALYLAIAANIPLITNNLGESGKIIEKLETRILLKRNSLSELIRVVSLLQDKIFYNSLKTKMLPLREIYNLKRVEKAISSLLK